MNSIHMAVYGSIKYLTHLLSNKYAISALLLYHFKLGTHDIYVYIYLYSIDMVA